MLRGEVDVREPVKQKGYVIVTVALTLALLSGFAALALDWGLLLSARTAAQAAADSAALAGAFTFVVQPLAPQPQTARELALSAATSNNITSAPIETSDVSVDVDPGNRRVTVSIRRSEGTFFARVLGWDRVDIEVQASAEASLTATGSTCAKPWFIPNAAASTLGSCDACAAGEVLISGGSVTAFAQSQLGAPFIIKPANPRNALAPGQFYAIAMPGSIGGADYRDNISTCSPVVVRCNETYSVEPGNMIGPTAQGVKELIGPDADTYIDLGRYQRSDGTLSDTSPQLISTPIWNECGMAGFCPAGELPADGRNTTIAVVGFAMLFLEDVQGNDVIARLTGISACGPGGGGGAGPAPRETGPYSVPVRLVRMP